MSREFLAPVLLVAIVVIQQYRVYAHRLSPWKGGGFGMFSTVDSPGARFLRSTLITKDGEYRVGIPSDYAKLVRLVRTVPTDQHINSLALALFQESWVTTLDFPNRRSASGGFEQYRESNSTRVSQLEFKVNQTNNMAPQDLSESAVDEVIPVMANSLHLPKYTVKSKSEPKPRSGEQTIPEGFRIELWRYNFDGDTRKLSAEIWGKSEYFKGSKED